MHGERSDTVRGFVLRPTFANASGTTLRIVQFTPQPLRSKPVPFDHSDYLFELKYDGFRALAYLENGRCRLVSRNGTTFVHSRFWPLQLLAIARITSGLRLAMVSFAQ